QVAPEVGIEREQARGDRDEAHRVGEERAGLIAFGDWRKRCLVGAHVTESASPGIASHDARIAVAVPTVVLMNDLPSVTGPGLSTLRLRSECRQPAKRVPRRRHDG